MKKAALVAIPVALMIVLTGCDDDEGDFEDHEIQREAPATIAPVQYDNTDEFTEVCINEEGVILPEDACDDDDHDGHSGGFIVWPMMAGHASSYSNFNHGTKLPASSYVKTKPKTGKFVKAAEFAKIAKTYADRQKAKNAEIKRSNDAKKLEADKLRAAKKVEAERAKAAQATQKNSQADTGQKSRTTETKRYGRSSSFGGRRGR